MAFGGLSRGGDDGDDLKHFSKNRSGPESAIIRFR